MTQNEQNLADLRVLVDAVRSGAAIPEDRLGVLARRYLSSSREGRGRIDPAAYADIVRSELTGRFIHQRREPNLTQASRMLAAALRRAAADIADRTHFVPCRLFDDAGTVGLAVGPVAFQPTGGFLASRAAAIADADLAARVERDFSPWDWTAEVAVRGCDLIVSRERALKAVDGALDMLRLHTGLAGARPLGRAGAPGLPAEAPAGLWADAQGCLHALHSGEGPAHDAAGILRRLHEKEGRDWLARAGRTLRPLADPSLDWPLATRFREAASWFGKGVTEGSHAVRILDFVTAIERAVVAGDHPEVGRSVTRRAALLGAAAEGGDPADWLRRAGDIYEIRSQIVHGALSPFAPEAAAMAPRVAALARAALCGALDFFETLGLTRGRISRERLEAEFRRLEARHLGHGDGRA